MTKIPFTNEQVAAALREINELAEAEYGLTLEQLLDGPMAEERLKRVAGVLLKMPFAKSCEPQSYNPTDAKRSWDWDMSRFDEGQLRKTGEFDLLEKLLEAEGMKSWRDLIGITHEAGLFWVLGRWVKGKIQGDQKTFQDYYYEKKSPEVDFALAGGYRSCLATS